MGQENNQDRPPVNQPVERNQPPFRTGNQGYDRRGDRWTPPPTGGGGGGNGGWIKVILVALVAIIIFCGYSFYSKNSTDTQVGILTGQMADYPNKVTQAINSVNTAIAGIPNSITTQVNSAVDSKISAIQSQINTITSDIATIKNQITTVQNQVASIPSNSTDIANIKSKIDTMQNQIFSLSADIQKLKDIINASDIQQNAISIEVNNDFSNFNVVNDHEYYVGNINTTGTFYTCANFSLVIRNNRATSIKLKDLKISLNLNLQASYLSMFDKLNIDHAILRTIIPLKDYTISPLYLMSQNDITIDDKSITILGNSIQTIKFRCYIYINNNNGVYSLIDINTQLINSMSIYPEVALISYTLG